MPDQNPANSAMGDIIGSTRRRLEQPGPPANPADRLKNLVAATTVAKPAPAAPIARQSTSGVMTWLLWRPRLVSV